MSKNILQVGTDKNKKRMYVPIWIYKREILRLLKAIWKLDDVKLFQIIYTNIKVHAKHRGIKL